MKRNQKKRNHLPKWTPFEEADFVQSSDGKVFKVDPKTRVFKNSRYQVVTSELHVEPFGAILWLSIKRIDKEIIRDWRELQKIKNTLAGPEVEAIEIFPAESRLMDTSNQYHLWCFTDGYKIPFGYANRVVTEGSSNNPLIAKAKQRPWDVEDRPSDLLSPDEVEGNLQDQVRMR